MGINKKNVVIANLKMYLPSKNDANRWLENFIRAKKNFNPEQTILVICPPIIFLNEFAKKITASWIDFGAQNCFWENEGSYTGEIGARMISSSGGKFVILGHSERRRELKENNQMIAKKIVHLLKNGLHPIVCIGETDLEKKQDKTMEVILCQLEECLREVSRSKIEDVIICYEPVWAISSNQPNKNPSANEIMSAKLLIKKFLVNKYGLKSAERVKIIYGGSVDDKNTEKICLETNISGVLVGKASVIPHTLLRICQVLENNNKN
jgi:triosephosphate isomerase